MSFEPIYNQESWRSWFERFTGGARGFLREVVPAVLPTFQMGRTLPESELPQFCGLGAGLSQDESLAAVVGITSLVDLRIERIEFYAPTQNAFTMSAANPRYYCLAFASDQWDPFAGVLTSFVPQFRPVIANEFFGPPSTTMFGGRAPFPPGGSYAHLTYPKSVPYGGSQAVERTVMEFGNDGLIVPAGLFLFLAEQNLGGVIPFPIIRNLFANFVFRELR